MEIKPYHKNAKKHPKKQIEQVANSIREFGMNQPIVVDKNGVIIVGHGRWEALKLLGWEIKDEYIKVVDISEEQAMAYRLADNKLNESDWDMELAIEELKGLSDEMFTLTGFEKDLIIDPDEKDDLITEVPTEPQSKLGDLYILGNHRVLCGDSTKIDDVEKLMDGKKADMVFTDPPYNIDFKDSKDRQIKNDNLKDNFKEFVNSFSYNIKEFSKNGYIYICFSQRFIKDYIDLIDLFGDYEIIIWKKDTAMRLGKDYRNYYEPIWLFRNGEVKFYGERKFEKNVWEFNSIHSAKSEDDNGKTWFKGGNKGLTVHPTQKPVNLINKAIKNSSKGEDIVLDTFLGSGSTLIACEKTNRVCYGMELDPKYVDVIIKRYCDYTGNNEIIKNGEKIFWKK